MERVVDTNTLSTMAKPYLATSRKISSLPGLDSLLGAPVLFHRDCKSAADCKGVIAWGKKPSSIKAAAFAERLNLPLIRIEDGFLRSVGLGNQEPPLSVVVDDAGIYYDASTPSRLEILIKADLSECQLDRARSLIAAWRQHRVSKYNHAREYSGTLPDDYVLVVDQTFGDASVSYGQAKASCFSDMLNAALAENPDSAVVVKIHPDVVNKKKRGYFDVSELAKNPRIMLLSYDLHPVSLIEQAQTVYCITSQIGFEALLWGKRVRTFGMPFYAGWGLTSDEQTPPERRHPTSLEHLVYAALIEYPRYLNPQTKGSCQVEELLSWMGLQRQMRERFPARLYAYGFTYGFSIYKQQFVRGFFQGSEIRFIKHLSQVPDGATLLVWGSTPIDFPSSEQAAEITILRLEDGFLRSVGLGAEFRVRPLSWTIDSRGIYYDSSKTSDLELLLQTTDFSEDLLLRSQKLRERIVANNLTKYNVGTAIQKSERIASSKAKIILVPGQVENDASITYGAPAIRRNIDLLQAVRKAHPNDYVIYKPHPDVVAGLRREGVEEDQADAWCDEVVVDRSMGELLLEVDEVHVLTSLSGFEALLRGKQVTCYGQPFYAGWGLTRDKVPIERRTRRLSLDELVAGALILYPLYLSGSNNRLITPEQAVDELLTWKNQQRAKPLNPFKKLLNHLYILAKKKYGYY